MTSASLNTSIEQNERIAYNQILNFARRFGEHHITLAMHSALPIGLTPDLVHLMRINFVRPAPWIAEVDLLLSPLCREVGGDFYEMDLLTRELLLDELKSDVLFGPKRLTEVAEFLYVYAGRELKITKQAELRDFLVAQQWTALAYAQPEKAAQELARAMNEGLRHNNSAETIRVADLTNILAAPLFTEEKVVLYAAGVNSLVSGDRSTALQLLEAVGPMSQHPNIAGVNLPTGEQLFQIFLPIEVPEDEGKDKRITYNELKEYLLKNKDVKVLDLRSKGIVKLPQEIGRLVNLQELNLSDNQLTDLPPEISRLTNLQRLNLSGNRLTILPQEIGHLANLQVLALEYNQLTTLPSEIGRLANLQDLSLGFNQLTVLPPEIGRLINLQMLKLGGNQLIALPPEICNLDNLEELRVDGNPLETPPPEIACRGIEFIQEYFRQMAAEGTDRLYEAKLLIVGDAGVGKTSFAHKIINSHYMFREDEVPTRGINVQSWEFDLNEGKTFRVNLWDFGGQEIYHATHQFFLTKRSLYVLIADTRLEHTDFYYWLNTVALLSDNSPILIILNEKQDRHIEINEHQLRTRFTNLKGVFATNLATNRGLDRIIEEIKYEITRLPHVGASLPRTWIKVRQFLENDPRNYVDLQEYLELCERCGFTERQDKLQLSGYLHDLGVCLHFQDDPILMRTLILKPEWGTAAVYKILDNSKVIENQGLFKREDLSEIWDEPEYAGRQVELLQLMKMFKLCYEIPGSPGSYLAPQLLSENKPDYKWDEKNNLFLRYTYEVMPKGIITRFILEMHQLIADQMLVWRSGVVLEMDETHAEVLENYHQRAIEIRVSGKLRKELLIIIIHEMDKIHDSYQRLKYQKLIPCNCDMCLLSQEPEFYPIEILRQFIAEKQDSIQCRRSFKMVSVQSLIDSMMEGDSHSETEVARTNVFVSYHHNDIKWIERLQTHLTPLIKDGVIHLWDDTRINTELYWRQQIEKDLSNAKAAILLISEDYLASEFLTTQSLQDLLTMAAIEGCLVLTVLVDFCRFEKPPGLNRPVNDRQALVGLNLEDQEKVFENVANEILNFHLNFHENVIRSFLRNIEIKQDNDVYGYKREFLIEQSLVILEMRKEWDDNDIDEEIIERYYFKIQDFFIITQSLFKLGSCNLNFMGGYSKFTWTWEKGNYRTVDEEVNIGNIIGNFYKSGARLDTSDISFNPTEKGIEWHNYKDYHFNHKAEYIQIIKERLII